jgi:hypothetical protein
MVTVFSAKADICNDTPLDLQNFV